MKIRNLNWAVRTFVLSIFLSIFFSVVSQSLFPTLPAFLSLFVIVFFMVFASIFDMIGVAVTSSSLENLEKRSSSKGFETAKKLCQNREKVSSFCGDVVGDICGILSGAGGVSLVLAMHIKEAGLYFLATCIVSSLIAGLTIFGKAILKGYAVENCEKVVLATGKVIEFSFVDFVKARVKKRKLKKAKKKKTSLLNAERQAPGSAEKQASKSNSIGSKVQTSGSAQTNLQTPRVRKQNK